MFSSTHICSGITRYEHEVRHDGLKWSFDLHARLSRVCISFLPSFFLSLLVRLENRIHGKALSSKNAFHLLGLSIKIAAYLSRSVRMAWTDPVLRSLTMGSLLCSSRFSAFSIAGVLGFSTFVKIPLKSWLGLLRILGFRGGALDRVGYACVFLTE
ncbi:hypothetical protein BJ546DRAFT_688636 [Cryomyces antarcticus]